MLHIDSILEGLHRFERGVLHLNGPVSESDLQALQSRLPSDLPSVWTALLTAHDGFDLRGDRFFGAAECLARWVRWQRDENARYMGLEGWRSAAPDSLLPVATDLEGNLKCVELHTGEVWDWHATSGRLTFWFSSLDRMMLCILQSLQSRFDAAGRPKANVTRRHGGPLPDDLLAHVHFEPSCPYAQLELARWFERNGTPEDALSCYRRALDYGVETIEAAYELGRFCVLAGRRAEARRALRRALRIPLARNPMCHMPPTGAMYAVHTMLNRLYTQVDQPRLSDVHKQAADKILKMEGVGWYGQSEEFARVLDVFESCA